jgi:hypothetical protein
MTRESVARRAAELTASWPLPPEDWQAIIDQATRVLAAVATLDELPLAEVEPAPLSPTSPAAGHE